MDSGLPVPGSQTVNTHKKGRRVLVNLAFLYAKPHQWHTKPFGFAAAVLCASIITLAG
jgi:hypothetical protein